MYFGDRSFSRSQFIPKMLQASLRCLVVGLSESKMSLECSVERRWEMFTNLVMACFLKKSSGGGILAAARR